MLTVGKEYNFNGSNNSIGEIEGFDYLSDCIKAGEPTTMPYNSCVINFYEDGNEYIGFHMDKEKGLVNESNIIISSFGATRVIRLKHNETNNVFDIELPDGSTFVLTRYLNKTYKHSIVKSKKIKEKRIQQNQPTSHLLAAHWLCSYLHEPPLACSPSDASCRTSWLGR
jgi:hypothetical protein